MRRPARTTLDPAVLDNGDIGRQTAQHDAYFDGGVEPTLRIVVTHFLEQLEEPQRTAVEMCIMKRMTYKEASDWFTAERGMQTDPKTVWRWAQQGVQRLATMFEKAHWVSAIEPKVPEDG
jgi:DNA-directed RNA polymerase specialized sigma24 family protein